MSSIASPSSAVAPKRRALRQRLKYTTATIYNYIKPIPVGSRSEREVLLFGQASSVVEAFTGTERAVLLRVVRTRSRAGPVAPSEKVVRDFERMRTEFGKGIVPNEHKPRGIKQETNLCGRRIIG